MPNKIKIVKLFKKNHYPQHIKKKNIYYWPKFKELAVYKKLKKEKT